VDLYGAGASTCGRFCVWVLAGEKAVIVTYLWAALAFVHLLGAWMMYSLCEEYFGLVAVAKHKVSFSVTCFLCWEFVAVYIIFTEPTKK
jgi:hypothetical protein